MHTLMGGWFQGRVRPLRLVVTLPAVYYFMSAVLTPETWRFIDMVNLIFHEAGHPLFMFFGSFLGALGGTLMQLFVPLVCIGALLKENDVWGASLVSLWFAQSMANVSVYVADARAMTLPLLGGDSVGHDWNFLLSALGLLPYDVLIGRSLQAVALAVALLACYVAFSQCRSATHETF